MSNREKKGPAKKSHDSENHQRNESEGDENMFEISSKLHTILLYQVSLFAAKISLFLSSMKIAKIFISWVIWALGFLMTLSIAHAASGGLFGEILAKILGITPDQVLTYTGDGTVDNSAKLWGLPPTVFQQVVPSQSCGAGKCIYGYDTSGNILCR
jgi:hypothetical protein